MMRTIRDLTMLGLALSLTFEAGFAQKKGRGFSVSIEGDDKMLTDCGQVRIEARGMETARAEKIETLPKSAVSKLRVSGPARGGIRVQGWDRDEYSVKACLAAAGENQADAQKLLGELSLSVQDGRVSVSGPSEENWLAYLLIQAPQASAMDLESKNGPIGLRAVSGTIEVRCTNGPLSLDDVSGQVRANVVNGPISVHGRRGDLRLNARNGPISVDLAGDRWESGELEAHATNGPLTLKLPADYRSPVRVEASKHSPVACRAAQCKEAVRTWDQPNRIEFGEGTPVVRLSTVNGPVSIKPAGGTI